MNIEQLEPTKECALAYLLPRQFWQINGCVPYVHLTRRMEQYRIRHCVDLRMGPHISLLDPFVPRGAFDEAAERATAALADMQPFRISFSRLASFSNRQRSVLYAQPDDPEGLVQVQARLFNAFPNCYHQNFVGKDRTPRPFTPHMTVGFYKTQPEMIKEQAALRWQPIADVEVTEVYLCHRIGPQMPYEIVHTVPLGCLPSPRHFGPSQAPPVRLILAPLPQTDNVIKQVQRAIGGPKPCIVELVKNNDGSDRPIAVVSGPEAWLLSFADKLTLQIGQNQVSVRLQANMAFP
jgi:2'-5' RNA ligase